MIKGARPIVSKEIQAHYDKFAFQSVSLESYAKIWERWITQSSNKTLNGIQPFKYRDFVCGTSQSFDHFWLRHQSKRKVCFAGEFQYHRCLGKYIGMQVLYDWKELRRGDALIISLPFSDLGGAHPQLQDILDSCDKFEIPVCLDLAYWGIARNINLDLKRHNCIEEFSCSLSKSFFVLENHRVGIRFSRCYNDDGISMINEVNMQNHYSMSLGTYFMEKFDCDWNWKKFGANQQTICHQYDLVPSDCVIFGLSAVKYQDYNRGLPNNNRVCISDLLTDL